jgi:hypothetical protein
MYARIENGEILEVGTPTHRPVYYAGRSWDCRNPEVREQYIIAANWIEVVTSPRPADTATDTSDLTYAMVEGLPTEVWTIRPWTTEELNAQEAEQARDELTDTEDLAARLVRLDAYATDPEIVAALDRTNSTTISTQDLNRLLKVMLRREQRFTATLALLVRLIDPALLLDITDTVDS